MIEGSSTQELVAEVPRSLFEPSDYFSSLFVLPTPTPLAPIPPEVTEKLF